MQSLWLEYDKAAADGPFILTCMLNSFLVKGCRGGEKIKIMEKNSISFVLPSFRPSVPGGSADLVALYRSFKGLVYMLSYLKQYVWGWR